MPTSPGAPASSASDWPPASASTSTSPRSTSTRHPPDGPCRRPSVAGIPPYSIFSATTEVLVTAAVFYVVWKAWHGDFRRALLVSVLVFEVLFNVSYMAYRMFWDTDGLEDIPDWLGSVA